MLINQHCTGSLLVLGITSVRPFFHISSPSSMVARGGCQNAPKPGNSLTSAIKCSHCALLRAMYFFTPHYPIPIFFPRLSATLLDRPALAPPRERPGGGQLDFVARARLRLVSLTVDFSNLVSNLPTFWTRPGAVQMAL